VSQDSKPLVFGEEAGVSSLVVGLESSGVGALHPVGWPGLRGARLLLVL
jgi:hypothetical protein